MNGIVFPHESGVFGGKAGALRALQRSGFPVPPWFVVAPQAFTDSVKTEDSPENWRASSARTRSPRPGARDIGR